VLNMGKLIFLDSAGLGMLAVAFEKSKAQCIGLCLVNPVGAVKRILDLTQIPRMMPVHETEEQALGQTLSVF